MFIQKLLDFGKFRSRVEFGVLTIACRSQGGLR